ncbi:hypothetical protein ACWEWD_34140 [Streptomyces tendae]
MNNDIAMDADAAARQARFGRLPERIRFDDMKTVVDADRRGTGGAPYNPEGSWQFYSCVALDLGL